MHNTSSDLGKPSKRTSTTPATDGPDPGVRRLAQEFMEHSQRELRGGRSRRSDGVVVLEAQAVRVRPDRHPRRGSETIAQVSAFNSSI